LKETGYLPPQYLAGNDNRTFNKPGLKSIKMRFDNWIHCPDSVSGKAVFLSALASISIVDDHSTKSIESHPSHRFRSVYKNPLASMRNVFQTLQAEQLH